MARSHYYFAEPDRPHFLTCTVVEWLPVFTCQEAVQVLFDSWQYLQRHRGLRLYGFVLQENHLHAVTQAENLPAVWQPFKSCMPRPCSGVLFRPAYVPLKPEIPAAPPRSCSPPAG